MSSPSAGKRRMDTDVIKLYPLLKFNNYIIFISCMNFMNIFQAFFFLEIISSVGVNLFFSTVVKDLKNSDFLIVIILLNT